MWVKMIDCELIDKSVIIVQAEFLGTESMKLSSGALPVSYGILNVNRVFKGDKHILLVQVQQPNPLKPISSSDIHFTKGQKGIWFLSAEKALVKGVYYANDPQRFWVEGEVDKLNKLLDRCSKTAG